MKAMGNQYDITIDHRMMQEAKGALNGCMQMAVKRAIMTGANEGSATLRISFEIAEVLNKETSEFEKVPVWKFRAGFSVPMKESMEATMPETGRLIETDEGWKLVSDQIHMDELMAEGN
jgi:hypothetical protein